MVREKATGVEIILRQNNYYGRKKMNMNMLKWYQEDGMADQMLDEYGEATTDEAKQAVLDRYGLTDQKDQVQRLVWLIDIESEHIDMHQDIFEAFMEKNHFSEQERDSFRGTHLAGLAAIWAYDTQKNAKISDCELIKGIEDFLYDRWEEIPLTVAKVIFHVGKQYPGVVAKCRQRYLNSKESVDTPAVLAKKDDTCQLISDHIATILDEIKTGSVINREDLVANLELIQEIAQK